MAFEPKKIYGSDFNGGIKYSLTDGFSPDDFNNIIEGLLYAQENGGSGGGVDQALVDQVNANTQEIGHLQSDSSRQEQAINNHTDSIHLLEEKDNAILDNTDGILDKAIKKGITGSTETLIDEEKTSACEWLGAIERPANTSGMGAYIKNGAGVTALLKFSEAPTKGTLAYRDGNGNFQVNAPVKETDCANKKYVDDKIAELLARIEALENK